MCKQRTGESSIPFSNWIGNVVGSLSSHSERTLRLDSLNGIIVCFSKNQGISYHGFEIYNFHCSNNLSNINDT